jgi:hypothetical protein
MVSVRHNGKKAYKVDKTHRVKLSQQKQPKTKRTKDENHIERDKVVECMNYLRRIPSIKFYLNLKKTLFEVSVYFNEKKTLVYRDKERQIRPVYRLICEITGWKQSAWKQHLYFSMKGPKPKHLIKFIDYFEGQY